MSNIKKFRQNVFLGVCFDVRRNATYALDRLVEIKEKMFFRNRQQGVRCYTRDCQVTEESIIKRCIVVLPSQRSGYYSSHIHAHICPIVYLSDWQVRT
jgi:hypothetical protein